MNFSSDFYRAGREYSTFEKQIQAPCFRREFLVQDVQKLENANVTICGLGLYELYVNGINITRGKLSSYFANPDDILYYDSYDLKQYLQDGINVIGVVLGNGVLNAWGGQEWDFHNARYRSAPKFALLFESTIGDSNFSFDASEFKCSAYPIVSNDIRCGEWYDARLKTGMIETSLGGEKIERWTMTDFDDSNWKNVILLETPRGEMRLCQAPPILPTKEIETVLIRKSRISILPKISKEFQKIECEDIPDREGYLYDFGVNIAGVCRIKIHNTKPGQKIILQFGELLGELGQEGVTIREEGSGLDLRGLHFLPHKYNNRDVYICKGGETEIWIPRFTYHGFRYCLVMGLEDNQAVKELLTCVVMNSAMTSRASFKCSDEVVNKLWEAGIVSDCANMYHIPTDCPHREKMDGQVMPHFRQNTC